MKLELSEVEVVVKEQSVTLTLTKEEAAMLFAICSGASGWTDENDIRSLTDSIWESFCKIFPDFYEQANHEYQPIVKKYIDTISQALVIG